MRSVQPWIGIDAQRSAQPSIGIDAQRSRHRLRTALTRPVVPHQLLHTLDVAILLVVIGAQRAIGVVMTSERTHLVRPVVVIAVEMVVEMVVDVAVEMVVEMAVEMPVVVIVPAVAVVIVVQMSGEMPVEMAEVVIVVGRAV